MTLRFETHDQPTELQVLREPYIYPKEVILGYLHFFYSFDCFIWLFHSLGQSIAFIHLVVSLPQSCLGMSFMHCFIWFFHSLGQSSAFIHLVVSLELFHSLRLYFCCIWCHLQQCLSSSLPTDPFSRGPFLPMTSMMTILRDPHSRARSLLFH